MAMEIFVLSDRKLGSIAEWQAAIDAEGFSFKLDQTDFRWHSGFLPGKLNGKLTGFECYHDSADEFIRENSDIDFGHEWKFVLGFRWMGDFHELEAAWTAAAAYASATNGVVFDDEDGSILTVAEARQAAEKIVRDTPRLLRERQLRS
jgi:hypothetical protein